MNQPDRSTSKLYEATTNTMPHEPISIGLTYPLDSSHLILLGYICTSFYCVILTIYRFYYSVIHTGKYYEKIRKLHEEYGPVVRVTPEDVHVMEPSAYHEIFGVGAVRKTGAYPHFSGGTGFEDLDMTAISIAHDAHRRLRVPLDQLCARNSILRMKSRIFDRATRLCDRLSCYEGTGEVVNLATALSSLTVEDYVDVLRAICERE
ncbi:hypothetical protein F5Y01DRAFT_62346 [Xylaria sp. FL0043]|nr:hypothetical protein F5Y01DRAFT_62346 [Xylaria sp. FL0043]